MIPAYNEISLRDVLASLYECDTVTLKVVVIVVFNYSENANNSIRNRNKLAFEETKELAKIYLDKLHIIPVYAENLPIKLAGVGYARKIGMDYAVNILSVHTADAVITCLDADSTCSNTYFTSIFKAFLQNPKMDAASIYFEHPTEKSIFDDKIISSIISYELHLRYYIQMQKFIGLPYAFHTVGSSMAVRASSYCRYGGMNTRKAGEDFYFLQKFISKGHVGNITSACVYPSPRISDRVPFGTGKAVGDMINKNTEEFMTYHYDSFYELSLLMTDIESLYENEWSVIKRKYPEHLVKWLEERRVQDKIIECRKHTSDVVAFKKRFFQWFDAFNLMKYLHWYRVHVKADIPVTSAAKHHLKTAGYADYPDHPSDLLNLYRLLDR